jgi:hypothetical protein
MPDRAAARATSAPISGLLNNFSAVARIRGSLGIGTSSASACASRISAATTRQSKRLIDACRDAVARAMRSRAAIMSAEARNTQTCAGSFFDSAAGT